MRGNLRQRTGTHAVYDDVEVGEEEGGMLYKNPLSQAEVTQARLQLAREMLMLVYGDFLKAIGGTEHCPSFVRTAVQREQNALRLVESVLGAYARGTR
ncbi:MAG TPA: hypothetical protein VLQ80_29715, partial [Candidatus Saccharimonadia bacterium]|nr:hypothetical protein [Candidatus Saccharimonadia bacterium]